MNLDLRDYTVYPAEVELTEEADNANYGVNVVAFIDTMTVRLNLQKVNEEFFCKGKVSVLTEQECSRCLGIYRKQMKGDLSFIIKTAEAKSVISTDDSLDLLFMRQGRPVVELNDLIRQSLSLASEMKPLCSDDCLGICPDCGVNRNEQDCDCKVEDVDERWEGLKDLYE